MRLDIFKIHVWISQKIVMIFIASRHCILTALHISNAFQNFVSQPNIS